MANYRIEYNQMPNNYFRFKQFTIKQGQAPFKVGTDGVLLGAWVQCENVRCALDIGSGTGLLALMIAQRCDAHIDAIEPNKQAFNQAFANIRDSPWNNRINIFQQSLQEWVKTYSPHHYDLIICNPPYFNRSLKNQDADLTMARHDDTLSIDHLISASSALLSEQGRLAIIYPASFADILIKTVHNHALHISREGWIKPAPHANANRIMLETTKIPGQVRREELSVRETASNAYTLAYKQLTRQFYLSF